MTDQDRNSGFYVSVSAEADEPDLVADVVFSGQEVADVRLIDGTWTVTLYDPFGVQGFSMPLDGFRAALDDAAVRLRKE